MDISHYITNVNYKKNLSFFRIKGLFLPNYLDAKLGICVTKINTKTNIKTNTKSNNKSKTSFFLCL